MTTSEEDNDDGSDTVNRGRAGERERDNVLRDKTMLMPMSVWRSTGKRNEG